MKFVKTCRFGGTSSIQNQVQSAKLYQQMGAYVFQNVPHFVLTFLKFHFTNAGAFCFNICKQSILTFQFKMTFSWKPWPKFNNGGDPRFYKALNNLKTKSSISFGSRNIF